MAPEFEDPPIQIPRPSKAALQAMSQAIVNIGPHVVARFFMGDPLVGGLPVEDTCYVGKFCTSGDWDYTRGVFANLGAYIIINNCPDFVSSIYPEIITLENRKADQPYVDGIPTITHVQYSLGNQKTYTAGDHILDTQELTTPLVGNEVGVTARFAFRYYPEDSRDEFSLSFEPIIVISPE